VLRRFENKPRLVIAPKKPIKKKYCLQYNSKTLKITIKSNDQGAPLVPKLNFKIKLSPPKMFKIVLENNVS